MYSIFPWFLSYLGLIYIGIGVAYNADKDCGKGQYKSDFLSGGCAKCPKLLKQCEDQEIDDARRCFIACKQRFSTIQPYLSSTASPQVLTVHTTSKTKSPPKVKKTIATEQVPDKSSSKKDYDRFMLSTSSYASNKQIGDSDVTSIFLGVVLSLVALLLVIAGCFALCWWTRKRNTTEAHEPKYTYNAAPPTPIHSEQSTDDVAIDVVDIEPSSLRSSCEDFQKLPQTEV